MRPNPRTSLRINYPITKPNQAIDVVDRRGGKLKKYKAIVVKPNGQFDSMCECKANGKKITCSWTGGAWIVLCNA